MITIVFSYISPFAHKECSYCSNNLSYYYKYVNTFRVKKPHYRQKVYLHRKKLSTKKQESPACRSMRGILVLVNQSSRSISQRLMAKRSSSETMIASCAGKRSSIFGSVYFTDSFLLVTRYTLRRLRQWRRSRGSCSFQPLPPSGRCGCNNPLRCRSGSRRQPD